MDKSAETNITTQLQHVDLEERPSRVEQELEHAAEAHHRFYLLIDDRTRLEDLAEEWIELLRASSRKTTS
jgi:hypothetical protein